MNTLLQCIELIYRCTCIKPMLIYVVSIWILIYWKHYLMEPVLSYMNSHLNVLNHLPLCRIRSFTYELEFKMYLCIHHIYDFNYQHIDVF